MRTAPTLIAASLLAASTLAPSARAADRNAVKLVANVGVGALDSIDGALAVGVRASIGEPLEFGLTATRVLGSSGRATDLALDLGYNFHGGGPFEFGPFIGAGYRAYEVDFDDVGYGPLVSGCTGVTGTTSLPYLALGGRVGHRVREMGVTWDIRGAVSWEPATSRPRTNGNFCYGPETGGQSYLVLDKVMGGFGVFATFGIGFGAPI